MTFEFKAGGRWSFTMHGPDGKSYPKFEYPDFARPLKDFLRTTNEQNLDRLTAEVPLGFSD